MKENIHYVDQRYIFDKDVENEKLIYFSSKFNEYGIPIYDGENGLATSYVLIQYCPWCGKQLPNSKRSEWFDCLEKLGFDSPLENFDEIPPKFKTSEWYETCTGDG